MLPMNGEIACDRLALAAASTGKPAPVALPVRGTRRMATVIANWSAGAEAGRTEAVLGTIRAGFQSRGWTVEMVRLPPARIASDCALFVREARGLIVAVGGDGTASAVASACRLHRRPFGLIPTGVRNRFAHASGLPMDPAVAVDALVRAEPVSIRYGQINNRVFLDHATIGLYPWLVSDKGERMPGRDETRLKGIGQAIGQGLATVLRPSPLFEVAIDDEGERRELRTSTLSLRPGIGIRQLDVRTLALRSRVELILTLGAALTGTLTAAVAVESMHARQVRIASRRRTIRVWLDGEPTLLEPPLDVRLRDSGLQLMLPPADGRPVEGEPAQRPAG